MAKEKETITFPNTPVEHIEFEDASDEKLKEMTDIYKRYKQIEEAKEILGVKPIDKLEVIFDEIVSELKDFKTIIYNLAYLLGFEVGPLEQNAEEEKKEEEETLEDIFKAMRDNIKEIKKVAQDMIEHNPADLIE